MKKVFLVLAIIPFIFSTCQQESNQSVDKETEESELSPEIIHQHATADEFTKTDNVGPQFGFESDVYDFGQVKLGEKASISFKFTNEGDADLVITDASAGCGCTVPDYSRKPLKPGESGFIDVTYNSQGRPIGRFNQTVTLTANTEPNKVYLRVSGEVVE